MLLEGVQEDGSKAEITFHKLLWVLWAVDTSKIEDKITIFTPCVKLLKSRVDVVLINLINDKVSITLCLAGLDVIELCTKIFAHKPLGSCY